MRKQQTGRALAQRRTARSRGSVVVAMIVLLLSAGVARGLADESGEAAVPADASLQMAEALLESVPSSANAEAAEAFSDTDPQAAEELPLEGLDRSEAEDVFSSVFPSALEVPAGIFNGLEVEKFNSDYAAVVAPSDSPVEGGQPGLLVSTVPLRTEAEDGSKEAVDLGLEPESGALQPQNPVVEVEMPASLEEGISLPESGVTVSLKDAPERGPSSLEGSSAFYPNVAADTDFSVSPTPTGFETFFDLRSADSPLTQTLQLSVPKGADLEATGDGGAKVVQGGEPQVTIQPPAAYDADGNPVPVSMQVAGDSLSLEVSPAPDAAYPILVDPVFQSWNWYGANSPEGLNTQPQWFASSNSALFTAPFMGAFGSQYGLNLRSAAGTVPAGSLSAWAYYVPRYYTDSPKPTSYIKSMTLSQVYFWLEENPITHWHPYLLLGLWDEKAGGSVSSFVRNSGEGGYSNATLPTLTNPNENANVKGFSVILSTSEAQSVARHFLAGGASVEITDNDSPGISPGAVPSGWANNTASVPLPYTATDSGLGVYELQLTQPLAAGGTKEVKTSIGCVGSAASPCPRTVKQSEKALAYEPATMATGEYWVPVTATDPVGHKSAAVEMRIRVDHTAPTIAPLTGTLTEQATLGTKRPSYTITAKASDGAKGAPQSGIAKEVVEVDGKVVGKEEKGCTTENCEATVNSTLEASNYTAGEHTLKVTATDAVGNVAIKELKFSLNPSPPALSLSGTMMEQGTIGTTRPRYVLKETASAEAGLETWTPSTTPTYASAFGSPGAGNGQFYHPADVAFDKAGNLWVADENNNRLEVFNGKGEFVKTIGSLGSGNGQFNKPKSIAFDGKGNVWISDSGNNRLQELSESTGAFVKAVGTKGNGNGQFNGPESIAIDAKGNIWVADTYNYRIEELNEKGEFLAIVNPSGVTPIEPTGIDVSGGNVWIADWAHNRVVELSEAGAWVRQFGSAGTGNGQFAQPDTVTVDSSGVVWVGDQNNGRVQGFNQSGEYLTQFGTKGTGTGQFSFAYPFGIATDSKGNLWVADANNNRVQKWTRTSSAITTETKVDGVKVDSGTTSCIAEKCPSTREWILPSSSYLGKHSVVVTATDGLGNTTTKSVAIEEKKDETKPTITLSGELPTATKGWVEQQPYTFKAEAADPGGYGVTSVSLKIDGSTVASSSGTCLEGTCPLTLSQGVNTGSLSGGAHAAVVTATDGAGNVQTKPWTVNVDPEGHISTAEVEDTLEALEGTSTANPIGEPEEEPEIEGTGAGMTVTETATGFDSAGTAVPAEVAADPSEGLAVEIPEEGIYQLCTELPLEEEPTEAEKEALEKEVAEGDPESECTEPMSQVPAAEDLNPVQVTPTNTESGALPTSSSSGGEAVVAADTSPHVDTITRPLYEGVMTFQDIRDSLAPASFSWTVDLEEGQKIELLDEQHAEVYYSGGHAAFGITAEPAHDAIGTEVPTSLAVSGNEVILFVHHREGHFVYPVIAGAGWQGGFVSGEVHEIPSGEEGGSVEEAGGEVIVRASVVGPPVASEMSELAEVAGRPKAPGHRFKFSECFWRAGVPEIGPPPDHREPIVEIIGNCLREKEEHFVSGLMVRGWFHYRSGEWVWVDKNRPGQIECFPWGNRAFRGKRINCYAHPWKAEEAITARGDFRKPGIGDLNECITIYGHLSAFIPHKEAQESIVELIPTREGEWKRCDFPAP